MRIIIISRTVRDSVNIIIMIIIVIIDRVINNTNNSSQRLFGCFPSVNSRLFMITVEWSMSRRRSFVIRKYGDSVDTANALTSCVLYVRSAFANSV